MPTERKRNGSPGGPGGGPPAATSGRPSGHSRCTRPPRGLHNRPDSRSRVLGCQLRGMAIRQKAHLAINAALPDNGKPQRQEEPPVTRSEAILANTRSPGRAVRRQQIKTEALNPRRLTANIGSSMVLEAPSRPGLKLTIRPRPGALYHPAYADCNYTRGAKTASVNPAVDQL